MRLGACALLLVATGAHGEPRTDLGVPDEPRLETSVFLGIGHVSSDLQLGDSWAPEQVPGTAPLVGARLHVLLVPELARDAHTRVQLGVEGEVQLAAAFTGSTIGTGGRASYFAPVLGWRAHARVRLASDTGPQPHALVGLGGATVASSSPFMRKETDPVFYWGLGVAVPVVDRWQIRLDGRHGVMAAQQSGVTSTFEVQFGVATTFGLPVRRIAGRRVARTPSQPIVDETDLDGDGLPDRLDRCPADRETVNGITDDDGCPEDDGDADGVVEASDRCPLQPEDLDGFEDDDGCPDPDNDGDGVLDGVDACPLQPETRNGFTDDDGCPDEVPAEVAAALAGSPTFENNRARITPAASKAMAALVTQLRKHRALRLSIVGHPHVADRDDLARRRADATKWYLIDQGLAEDRIETTVGAVDATRALSFRLISP